LKSYQRINTQRFRDLHFSLIQARPKSSHRLSVCSRARRNHDCIPSSVLRVEWYHISHAILQANLSFVSARSQAQSLNEILPSWASPFPPLEIVKQLLPLVYQQPQIPLVDLVCLSSCLQKVGQCPDLRRQNSSLHLATSGVRSCTRGLLQLCLSQSRRRARCLWRQNLVCVVSSKCIDTPLNVHS